MPLTRRRTRSEARKREKLEPARANIHTPDVFPRHKTKRRESRTRHLDGGLTHPRRIHNKPTTKPHIPNNRYNCIRPQRPRQTPGCNKYCRAPTPPYYKYYGAGYYTLCSRCYTLYSPYYKVCSLYNTVCSLIRSPSIRSPSRARAWAAH